MADGQNTNGLLYGVIGALAVVVAGGGFYVYKVNNPDTPPVATATSAPTPAPPPAAAPRPAPPPAAPAGPTAAEQSLARGLVADARRAMQRHDFAAADRALDQAERMDPRSAEVIDARRDLRDAQRREAQRDNRIDALVATARAAIARHDYVAADRALDEAERIDGRDRDVQEARAELTAAQRPGRRN